MFSNVRFEFELSSCGMVCCACGECSLICSHYPVTSFEAGLAGNWMRVVSAINNIRFISLTPERDLIPYERRIKQDSLQHAQ
jgi:coenzyme F420-reducing hydrogenase beta subunit